MKTLCLLRRCVPAIRLLVNVGIIWTFTIASFAQDIDYGDYEGDLKGPPKSYVPIYIIMIAFVGLALTLVCRTSRRNVHE